MMAFTEAPRWLVKACALTRFEDPTAFMLWDMPVGASGRTAAVWNKDGVCHQFDELDRDSVLTEFKDFME